MMLTQSFYWRYNGAALWSTTASDSLYSTRSRANILTPLKPTARQVRQLKKASRKQQGK